MSQSVSKATRLRVAQRAGYRCEYCRISEEDSFLPFQIDHIIGRKHGGGDELENLAYACPQCNQHKGTDLATYLSSYEDIVALFNPRQHLWGDHFSIDEGRIAPKSRTGAATVKLLRFNEPERLIHRKILMEIGHYP